MRLLALVQGLPDAEMWSLPFYHSQIRSIYPWLPSLAASITPSSATHPDWEVKKVSDANIGTYVARNCRVSGKFVRYSDCLHYLALERMIDS